MVGQTGMYLTGGVLIEEGADRATAETDAARQRDLQRAGQLHHWGVVIGMVLAANLAAERSAALGDLAGGSIVRLDQFRNQLGGVSPGQNPLVDF